MAFYGIKRVHFASVLAALTLAISPALLVSAQVTGATLSGTITDGSRAELPGARVVIENRSTEITRNSVTDKMVSTARQTFPPAAMR